MIPTLAEFRLRQIVREDRVGCGDCGRMVDTSNVSTEDEALERLHEHVERHHGGNDD